MATQHYSGSCQCQAVTFEADLDLDSTFICNCSRCQRLGTVLSFTAPENFSLKSGEDNLTEYLFNNKRIRHLFCKTCGVQSFAFGTKRDGSRNVAVNVNCIDGAEPRALPSQPVDGRSF
jgi:hypothetical protein